MPYLPNYSIMSFQDSRGKFDLGESYKKIVNNINSQIEQQNKQNSIINRITSFGYFLTSFSCFYSGYTSNKKRRRIIKNKIKRVDNSAEIKK